MPYKGKVSVMLYDWAGGPLEFRPLVEEYGDTVGFYASASAVHVFRKRHKIRDWGRRLLARFRTPPRPQLQRKRRSRDGQGTLFPD
jgi:hypothetical protein